jgi:hypothetical protein
VDSFGWHAELPAGVAGCCVESVGVTCRWRRCCCRKSWRDVAGKGAKVTRLGAAGQAAGVTGTLEVDQGEEQATGGSCGWQWLPPSEMDPGAQSNR